MPAPTMALMRLKVAPRREDLGSSSSSLRREIDPPGVVRIWDRGGCGAKKGDLLIL